MEKENRGFLNSPVIQKNTPIKRLGLSRKRKSCNSESSSNAKIPAYDETSSTFLNLQVSFAKESFLYFNALLKSFYSIPDIIKCMLNQENSNDSRDTENEDNNSTKNYDEEIESLKIKIKEKEEKLVTLKCNKNNTQQLETLIELWKNGCKNAFLHLSQLIEEKESEEVDLKSVLSRLGVWETIIKYFQDDPEILGLQNSQ